MAAPAGGPATQANRSLHRDVLKWVQSLDLALPVKNPRRDFANGVLVAQIYSRTYEADISMHGFQNGNSLKVKRDNWSQLKRCVGRSPTACVAHATGSAVAWRGPSRSTARGAAWGVARRSRPAGRGCQAWQRGVASRFAPRARTARPACDDSGPGTTWTRDAARRRFFRKRGICPGGKPVTDAEVENIIHARAGAAVSFVHRTYSLLTGKQVRAPRAGSTGPAVTVPAYAQPTAARVVYERSRDPEVELRTDEGERAGVMAAALSGHKQSLQRQREEQPERFVPTSVRAERAARALEAQRQPHAVAEEAGPVRAVTVRQVRVRRLGDAEGGAAGAAGGGAGGSAGAASAARLRAERELRADALREPSTGTLGSDSAMMGGGSLLEAASMMGGAADERAAAASGRGSGAGRGHSGSAGDAGSASGSRALDIMSGAIARSLAGSGFEGKLDTGRPAAFALVDVLTSDSSFPDEVAAAAIAAVAAETPALADACLDSPRGFLHVVSLLQPLLAGIVEATETFVSVARAYEELGLAMAERDRALAFQLLKDLAVPALVMLVKHRPAKRLHILRVMYSFTGAVVRHRRAVITTLHEQLADLGSFLSCLSLLIYIEHDLHSLLELYLYYARVGIAVPSPHLRAAAVAMLGVVASEYPAAVAPFLPKLEGLLSDSWWELRAQLAVLASAFLAVLDSVEVAADADGQGDEGAPPPSGAAQLDDWLSGLLSGAHGVALPLPQQAANESRQSALRILDATLRPGVSRGLALRVAVAYSAKALAVEPAIAPRFLECLCSLDVNVAARLLDLDPHGRPDELPVTGHSGGRYIQPSVPDEWPAGLMAETAVLRFEPEAPGALSPQALAVVMALLRPVRDGGEEQPQGGKEDEDGEDADADGPLRIGPGLEDRLFVPLQEHVAASLQDPATCRFGLDIISFVALYGEAGPAAITHPSVVSAIAGLQQQEASPAQEQCLGTLSRVLGELAKQGLADAVHECISLVADAAGGLPPASPLHRLAEQLQ